MEAGIIRVTRDQIESVQAGISGELARTRQGLVDEAFRGMEDILEQPEYTGDIETALVHFAGEQALVDHDLTGPYLTLSDNLKAAEEPNQPVLIVYKQPDGTEVAPRDTENIFRPDPIQMGQFTHSSLIKIDPANLLFKSVKTRRQDVPMHAFATKDTAAVTDSTLSIVGDTITADMNVLTEGPARRRSTKAKDSFVIGETRIADNGEGQSRLGDYQFSDYRAYLPYRSPLVVIGWNKIEELFTDSSCKIDGLQQIIKAYELFYSSGDLIDLNEAAPKLDEIFEATDQCLKALGRKSLLDIVKP